MKYIDPKNLTIPRAYFTEFDRVTYSQVAWTEKDIEEIKLNLERKVKLLGCIKGVVVIATSHLLTHKTTTYGSGALKRVIPLY